MDMLVVQILKIILSSFDINIHSDNKIILKDNESDYVVF
jgi:hypothetical protein